MALVAWYPLNGSIENYGIGDADLSGTGQQFANSKFGQGLCGGYKEFKWTAEQTGKILNSKEMSFCFWVYVTAPTGDTTGRAMFFGNDPMRTTDNRHFSIFQYPSCNDLHLSWQRDGADGLVSGSVNSGVFPSYKWTHCAIIFKDKHVYIYINNELIYTGNASYQIGDKFDYETVVLRQINSRILNDFRVYNHALSKQELCEVYKTCVLHYKFDDLNLVPNLANRYSDGYAVASTSFTRKKVSNYTNFTGHFNPSGNSWPNIYYPFYKFTPDKAYTISFKVRVNVCSGGGYLTFRHARLENDYFGCLTNNAVTSERAGTGIWYQESLTQVIPESFTSGDLKKCNPHLEFCTNNLKDKDCYFDFDIKDIIITETSSYVPFHTNSGKTNTIADTSGFNNNSTRIENIKIVQDTNLGGYAAKFNKSAVALPQRTKINKNFSFNMWAYRDNWSTIDNCALISCTQGGGWGFGIWSGSNGSSAKEFYLDVFEEGRGYVGPTGTGYFPTQLAAGWHMFTGTFDNTNFRIYIDSVLIFTSGAFNSSYVMGYNSANSIFLGVEAGDSPTYSANYNYFYGLMSDFSLYASTLDSTDIIQMYKSRANIDKNYVLATDTYYEHPKQATYGLLNKNGIFDVKQLLEPATVQLIDGSQWLCIFSHDIRDGIEWFTGNSEANTCVNRENRYSLLTKLNDPKIRAGGTTAGKYEFILEYPEKGYLGKTTSYNRWKQLANPLIIKSDNDTTVEQVGYEGIHISWTNAWGHGMGLTTSGASYLDCEIGRPGWFGAIGQRGYWSEKDGLYIPAADGSNVKFVRLWIRIDNTAYKGWFQTYNNGSLVTSSFKEN